MSWLRRRVNLPVQMEDFIEERLLLADLDNFSWERRPGAATTELSLFAEDPADLPAPGLLGAWLREAAAAGLPACELVYADESLEAQDWNEGFRRHFATRRIAERIVIIPSWERQGLRRRGDAVAPGEDLELIIEPGQAFGTGEHPTTRACLLRLEAWFRSGAGRGASCLDIGCGTGVLGIAAKLWGAGRVLGYDIDPESIVNAYLNSDLNGLAGRMRFLWGEAVDLEDASWDLVLCNLFLGPILRLVPRMDAALRPGGTVILSGFLERQVQALRDAGRARGWALAAETSDDDWVVQEWRKPA